MALGSFGKLTIAHAILAVLLIIELGIVGWRKSPLSSSSFPSSPPPCKPVLTFVCHSRLRHLGRFPIPLPALQLHLVHSRPALRRHRALRPPEHRHSSRRSGCPGAHLALLVCRLHRHGGLGWQLLRKLVPYCASRRRLWLLHLGWLHGVGRYGRSSLEEGRRQHQVDALEPWCLNTCFDANNNNQV